MQWMHKCMVVGAVVSVTACDNRPPTVYVPVDQPATTVEIAISAAEVDVGKPLILHASRTNTGKWQAVKSSALSAEDCWMSQPPPAFEDAVADNVNWQVTPSDHHSFDISPRQDHARVVRFSKPGIYRIQGYSRAWCAGEREFGSNTVTVNVNQPDTDHAGN